jgi:hypothetical protein
MAINRFALSAELIREAASAPGSVLPTLFPILPSQAVITPTMTVLMVGAYAGGLIFFFQARRRGSIG